MESKITSLVSDIATLIFHISFGVAVAMIAAGGVYYAVSAGNLQHVHASRSWITSAVLGLAITILASALVSFIAQHLGVSGAIPQPAMSAMLDIPTHLTVEDRPFFGRTVGEFAVLAVGFLVATALWALDLGSLGGRLVATLACLGASLLLVAIRPRGRRIPTWIGILLRYRATPRRGVWRSWRKEHQ